MEFAWVVEPATTLYRTNSFAFEVEPPVDFRIVPRWLWWRIALIALHSHWTLLRPCRIVLPIRLEPGERETWERLLDYESTTVDVYADAPLNGAVRIEEGADEPDRGNLSDPAAARFATAFSGGKDSLLQAGMLAEFTHSPLLVTLTSDLPPQQDHHTSRRRYVLDEVRRRREVELVEVTSGVRAAYDNYYGRDRGIPISVNELSDGMVYLAATLAVSAARGASQVCVASEIENQVTAEIDGRIIGCAFLSDVVVFGALSAILSPAGITVESLISPLRSGHVQALLWQRYRDLADLQYSCWLVKEPCAACSACDKCALVAFRMLRAGHDPGDVGIDLRRTIAWIAGWHPVANGSHGFRLPTQVVGRELDRELARLVAVVPLATVSRLDWRAGLALAKQKLRFRKYRDGQPGYWPQYLRFLHPKLGHDLGPVLAASFTAAFSEGAVNAARAERMIGWMTEPVVKAQQHEEGRERSSRPS